MGDGDAVPLRGRDVLVALCVVVALVGVAVASDPQTRTTLVSQPVLREVLCPDELLVDVVTSSPGNALSVPEGGLAVRAHVGEENVSSRLELFRRDPGEDWAMAWALDAPAGHEVFYVANVEPGTEAYVVAKPVSEALCPARSPVLVAAR